MKTALNSIVIALGLTSSITALATTYKFNCPYPDQVKYTPNNAVLYSPYDAASGMPENMQGDNGTGVNAAWSGLIIGPKYNSITTIAFGAVSIVEINNVVSSLYCIYNLQGKDDQGNQVNSTVYMTPGNGSYLSLYSYSLSGNNIQYNTSTDITTLIVAADLSK